ncbi:MAG: hypothetical protein HQM00_00710, partial [Magnetococcales bacterium]|nr:hypothetical protein [Magnetococcales bacterium]
IQSVQALPVSEVILTEETSRAFRTTFRQIHGTGACEDDLYKQVSKGDKSPGMEQYLPLFYDPAETFFDYLPASTIFLLDTDTLAEARHFDAEVQERLESLQQESKLNPSRPPPPDTLYLTEAGFLEQLNRFSVFATTHQAAPGGVSMGFDPAP